ncbi:MAG: hypothetical protein KatS3mg014_0920 [Actinomycetota bacterium]|nr:MAG: hypothetical protein KatS3mg014_0920 [Actinomycetota bacterium]
MADRPVDRTGLALGIAFVAAGVLFLLDRLEVISLRASVVLPIFLIALGIAILLGAGRER